MASVSGSGVMKTPRSNGGRLEQIAAAKNTAHRKRAADRPAALTMSAAGGLRQRDLAGEIRRHIGAGGDAEDGPNVLAARRQAHIVAEEMAGVDGGRVQNVERVDR